MPTLLIVRPPEQAAADLRICAEAGWRGVAASPFAVEADPAALAALPPRFQAADAVFWVSPSAVAVAAPHLDFSDGLSRLSSRHCKGTHHENPPRPYPRPVRRPCRRAAARCGRAKIAGKRPHHHRACRNEILRWTCCSAPT